MMRFIAIPALDQRTHLSCLMSPHGPSHGLEKAGIPAKPPRLIGPADNHVGQVEALKAPHVQEADLKFCVLLPYLHRHIKVLEYAPRSQGPKLQRTAPRVCVQFSRHVSAAGMYRPYPRDSVQLYSAFAQPPAQEMSLRRICDA